MDSSALTLRTGPFTIEGVSGYFLLLSYMHYIEIAVFNLNSVNPDQTPRSVASDLGLHCLSECKYARHKWVHLIMRLNFFSNR